jgi:hypothetical protein
LWKEKKRRKTGWLFGQSFVEGEIGRGKIVRSLKVHKAADTSSDTIRKKDRML